MKHYRRLRPYLPAAMTAVLTLLAWPRDANAQGCAMCYQTASVAGGVGLESLQNGILILLAPPLLFVGVLGWHLYQRSRSPEEVFPAAGAAPSLRTGARSVPQQ